MDALRERLQRARDVIARAANELNDRFHELVLQDPIYLLTLKFVMIVLCFFLLLYLHALLLFITPLRIKYVDLPTVNLSEPTKTPQILLWSPSGYPWDEMVPPSRRGFLTLSCSPNSTDICYVTKSRDDIFKSDAVVVSTESIDSTDLPSDLQRNLTWVLLTSGPTPAPIPRFLAQMTPPFNWTMGLREDSDIVAPYRLWEETSANHSVSSLVVAFGDKNMTAVWMISKCEQEMMERTRRYSFTDDVWSGTERFISAVVHNFDVDIINNCGADLCASADECLSLLADTHVFVIVMESSPCFEHPAEIVYASLKFNIIPVLFGVGKFTHSLPPHSFVDTTSYADAGEAISLLRRISRSPQYYTDFIAKRRVYSVSTPPVLCALCGALHATPMKSRHSDLENWWLTRSTCSLFKLQAGNDNATQRVATANSPHV